MTRLILIALHLALGLIGCSSGGPGEVDVNASIAPADAPPTITDMLVAPLQIAVGGTIDVEVMAIDPDPEDRLTFAWSVTPDGRFTDPTAAITNFSSKIPGSKTLTITVDDNHTARPRSTSASVTVRFVGTF